MLHDGIHAHDEGRGVLHMRGSDLLRKVSLNEGVYKQR